MNQILSDQYVFLKNIHDLDIKTGTVLNKLDVLAKDYNDEMQNLSRDSIITTLVSVADSFLLMFKPFIELKNEIMARKRSELQKKLRNEAAVINIGEGDVAEGNFEVDISDPYPLDEDLFKSVMNGLLKAKKMANFVERIIVNDLILKMRNMCADFRKMKTHIMEAKLNDLCRQLSLSINADPKVCAICLEREVNSVVYKCGHMCMCFECAEGLLRNAEHIHCPVCRTEITDVIRAYWS